MNVQEIKERLKSGNNRYISDKENLSSDTDLRNSLTSGQSPFAIILSCADSRVVPEMIFDCNIGELFVVRVAGNIANSSSIASIVAVIVMFVIKKYTYCVVLSKNHTSSCFCCSVTIHTYSIVWFLIKNHTSAMKWMIVN